MDGGVPTGRTYWAGIARTEEASTIGEVANLRVREEGTSVPGKESRCKRRAVGLVGGRVPHAFQRLFKAHPRLPC